MDFKELRIGNYVGATFAGNDIPELHGIDKSTFELNGFAPHQIDCGGDIQNATHWYFPIPLTEEWLEAFGLKLQLVSKHDFKFNKVLRTDKIYTTNPFNLEEEYNFEIEVVKDGDDNVVRRIGVKGIEYLDASNILYVHDLQNIHFALTKTELVLQERGEKV